MRNRHCTYREEGGRRLFSDCFLPLLSLPLLPPPTTTFFLLSSFPHHPPISLLAACTGWMDGCRRHTRLLASPSLSPEAKLVPLPPRHPLRREGVFSACCNSLKRRRALSLSLSLHPHPPPPPSLIFQAQRSDTDGRMNPPPPPPPFPPIRPYRATAAATTSSSSPSSVSVKTSALPSFRKLPSFPSVSAARDFRRRGPTPAIEGKEHRITCCFPQFFPYSMFSER